MKKEREKVDLDQGNISFFRREKSIKRKKVRNNYKL